MPANRATVITLRSAGTSAVTIAKVLRIDYRTLRDNYAEELAEGKATKAV
jgi:hypothetical protein